MANDGFNGTTVTFAGVTVPLQSVNFNETGAKVDVTGSTSSQHEYVAGLSDKDVDFTIVGVSTGATVGTTAALTIAWFDGTTQALGGFGVVGRSISGSIDGAITTTITLAKLQ